MNPRIFREYDVRGLVGDDLDEATFHRIGLALGTWLDRHGDLTAVVGHDVRPTSPTFAAALRRGLVETGRRVLDLGAATTPMVVFGLNLLGAHGSAAVTASHNPAAYNGAKLRRRRPIFGPELKQLGRLAEEGPFARGTGHEERADVREAYLLGLLGRARARRALKVVVDCGNGAGSLVGPDALESAGFEVVRLFAEPDGTFPNHPPDPTDPENLTALRQAVESERADCGVAFDGDADRVVFVDGAGTIHWPDRVLMLLARRILPRRQGGAVVFDVKCSQGVADVVEASGGRPVMVRTGYPFLLEGMRDPDAILGAELSGHQYFGQDGVFDFDDGVHAACRVLEMLSADPRPVAEQFAELPATVATPEIRARCPEERKFAVVDDLLAHFRKDGDVVRLIDIDGARVHYRDGWGLVRASNTGPYLVLVFESADETGLRRVKDRFAAALARFPEVEVDLS